MYQIIMFYFGMRLKVDMIRACIFISLYDRRRSVLYSIMQILYYLINNENSNPKTDYNYTFAG